MGGTVLKKYFYKCRL